MSDSVFSDKLDRFYQRLEALLQNHVDPAAPAEEISQARQELLTFVEELRVSVEELSDRNLDLQVARSRIEVERSRYRDMFQFAPDGYLNTDKDGIILEANRTAVEMLNVPAGFLVRKPLASYIHEENRQQFRQQLVRAIQSLEATGERVERWELRFQPRNRLPFYALLTVGISRRPLSNRTGTGAEDAIMVRWMVHDVTEQRQAREALQQAQEELEKRVQERTEELSSAYLDLQQTANQLEARNKELQDFAFIASHDLQEPMRKVRAFADVLLERTQDPGDADYLERMRTAAIRMQAMLDGLLEYARVTSQGRPMEPTDLNEVCREVVFDLELRVQQAEAQVELAPLPVVNADPLQMYRLFQNLLTNALKFHPPDRPPVVKITGRQNGERVVLAVSDNGIGFDPAHLSRLFQPFARLNGRSMFEGSGMGLAICRKIAERHGGSITAEGAIDQGATFIITLPAIH